MFRQVYDAIRGEISGDNARNLAATIWRHDRDSTFAGYYETARYCLAQLRQAGARAELVTFPADGKATYGTTVLQRAWDCRQASLEVLEPVTDARRLVSYPAQPFGCVQGSPPTPAGGVEAEVVVVTGGGQARDYRGLRVKGKFVLTDTAAGSVHQEAQKQGAVGVISDAMATNPVVRKDPMDLPDALLWQVMRPAGALPAFVLSPRQGKWLRGLIARRTAEGATVRVRARVDARVCDGRLEMVSGLLRGRSDQEVALMAHFAEPGANDNASGAGLCVEIARALQALIKAGKLSRPRRGLRVWLTHEVYSLQAHAVTDPQAMARVVAAHNLDMVGEDMARCGSVLMYQDSPDAAPSFINHLLRELLEHFRRGFHAWPNLSSSQAFFPALETPFWGNDNFISDPSIGVPSVAFINWPDRYYHTSEDTPDKLSAETLARAGALAATFVYTIANAGKSEAVVLAEMVAAQAPALLEREVTAQAAKARDALAEEQDDLDERLAHGLNRLEYLRQRELAALRSVNVLLSATESKQIAPRLGELEGELQAAHATAQRRYRRLLGDLARSHGRGEPQQPAVRPLRQDERRAAAIVPRRLLIGPVSPARFPETAKALLNRAAKGGLPGRLLFWVDGRRSLLEVGRLAALEEDKAPPPARRLLQWFEGMKLGGALGE